MAGRVAGVVLICEEGAFPEAQAWRYKAAFAVEPERDDPALCRRAAKQGCRRAARSA